MKTTIFIILLIFTPNLLAGGDYFPIKVLSIDYNENANHFSIFASTMNDIKPWYDSECSKITVVGSYDHNKWAKYVKLMSFKLHKQSILYLKSSISNATKVLFGFLGNGLVANGSCNYKSKGLVILDDKVFSVHDSM